MIDKERILRNLQLLLISAIKRNTKQGVVVYEGAQKMITEASTDDEIKAVLEKLYAALSGIEAHGFFTDEEYELVTDIRNLCKTN